MDFILTILVVGVVGLFKVVSAEGVTPVATTPIIESGVEQVIAVTSNTREVGNNLMLKCDTEAFTMILKEFGLD